MLTKSIASIYSKLIVDMNFWSIHKFVENWKMYSKALTSFSLTLSSLYCVHMVMCVSCIAYALYGVLKFGTIHKLWISKFFFLVLGKMINRNYLVYRCFDEVKRIFILTQSSFKRKIHLNTCTLYMWVYLQNKWALP